MTMQDFLSRFASDDLMGLVALVLCFVAGMTVWLSLQWRLHRRAEMEVALKQDMLERGMTAEEIERVLRAQSSGTCQEGPGKNDSMPVQRSLRGQRIR